MNGVRQHFYSIVDRKINDSKISPWTKILFHMPESRSVIIVLEETDVGKINSSLKNQNLFAMMTYITSTENYNFKKNKEIKRLTLVGTLGWYILRNFDPPRRKSVFRTATSKHICNIAWYLMTIDLFGSFWTYLYW